MQLLTRRTLSVISMFFCAWIGFAEAHPLHGGSRGSTATLAGEPWINELHYDNAGTDVNEGVEIAGMAGLDLSNYAIVLYNGNGGGTYSSSPVFSQLSGLIDDEGSGFGALWFPISGIQNGSPDGLALVNTVTNVVVQFLSYEGAFTATNGAANMQMSVDIGVQESGTSPIGESLQLIGSGSSYADFMWTGPVLSSAGTLNVGQSIVIPTGNQPPNAGPARVGVRLPTSGGASCPNAVMVFNSFGNMLTAGQVLDVGAVLTVAGLGVPAPTSAEVSDDRDADEDLEVNVVSVQISSATCSTSVAITYTITDRDGAVSAARTDSFIVVDDTAPSFTTPAASLDDTLTVSAFPAALMSGSCADDVDLIALAAQVEANTNAQMAGLIGVAAATDSCGSVLYTVSASYEAGATSCLAVIQLSTVAADSCGNTSQPFLTRITVVSDSQPTLPISSIITAQTSAGANCLAPFGTLMSGDVFAPGAAVTVGGTSVMLPSASSIIGCLGANPTFTFTSTTSETQAGSCATLYTAAFAFNADCGGATPVNYAVQVNVIDNSAPVVTVPGPVQISCTDDSNDLMLTGQASATDNCAPLTTSAPLVAAGQLFINEIHYDNIGNDVGESVEVAGPAGTDLSTYSLVLYNGSNNSVYSTIPLSGVIPDEGSGYGALAFAAGLQNGSPDGIALCGPLGLVEFLSYEGVMTGMGGCANGVTSTDIGVEEGSSTPVGTSLQRTGTGVNAGSFVWVAGVTASAGSLNANQTIQMPGGGGGSAGGPVATTFTDNVVAGTCPGNSQIFRTFSATDACGNVGTALQIITVRDTTAPVFTNAPGSLNASITTSQLAAAGFGNCAAAIDATAIQLAINFGILFGSPTGSGLFAIPTATDNCSEASLLAVSVTTGNVQGTAPCAVDIIVTFRARDDCGNTSFFTTNLTVNDDEPAVVSANFQTNVTVACGNPTDTTVTGFPVFYDNCGSSAPAVATAFINEFHYDNAGNDANEFVEIAGPAGLNLAGWSIVLYNGSNNAPYNTRPLTGVIPDQGSGAGALAFFYPVNGIQNGSPDGIALADAMGNLVEFISYEGPMTGVGGPADGVAATAIQVSEDGSQPDTTSLQRIGAGSKGSSFTFVGPRSWSPGLLNNGQTYLSGQSVTVSFGESLSPNPNCANGQIITRTFTANDGCGNTSQVVQTITVIDTVAPVFVTFPRDTVISCSILPGGVTLTNLQAVANQQGQPLISDNCATGLTAAFTDNFTSNVGCAGQLVRTFGPVDDGCGNVLPARTLTITVIDTVAPVFAAFPRDTVVSCSSVSGGVTLANLSAFATARGLPTVTDNCATGLTASFSDSFTASTTCANGGTFRRTFAALNDGCGNVLAARTLTITVIDTVAPVFAAFPRDTVVSCASLSGQSLAAGASAVATALGLPVVSDNCSAGLVAPFSDSFSSGGPCPIIGVLTRTYGPVNDGCGNVLPARTLRVTIIDTLPPVFAGLPVAGDFPCELGLPAAGLVTATDCSPGVVVTTQDEVITVAQNFVVSVTTRTYTATDGCGNSATAIRRFRLIDNQEPVVVSCPSNIGPLVADADDRLLVNFQEPVFSDNCAFTVTGNVTSGTRLPVGVTTVTYTARDEGGSFNVCSFTIEVVKALNIDCDYVDIAIDQIGDLTRGEVNFPYVETTCTVCPQGAPLPGLDYLGYFEGHRYYVSAPGFGNGWLGAQRYGVDLGARVAQIDSEAENRFIQGEIEVDEVYIGLLRDAGASDWRTTFSSTDYRNWAPGEPQADPFAKYAVLRKRDGKHEAVRDQPRAYVLEFPCIDVDVNFLPADSLYGYGVRTVQYIATDDCGNRDTCNYQVNVTNFNVNYCTPALGRSYPGEEEVYVTRVELGAFAKTIAADDLYFHLRDTLIVPEDQAVRLRLAAETTGVEGADFTAYWRIWVDADGDGDFYESGEQIFEGVGNSALDTTFILPSSLRLSGPRRLRVAVSRYGYPAPCGASPFLDHEDFTLRSTTVRQGPLVLSARLRHTTPELTVSSAEDAAVDRYLLLRGNSPNALTKYMRWDATLRNGERVVYTQTDLDPMLRAYYQAVTLGNDGEPLSYSNVVELRLPVRRGGGIKVYPNPTSRDLTVERDAEHEVAAEDCQVEFHDVLGRRILTGVWPAGQERLTLRLPVLPSGTYFLRTMDDLGELATQRVIVQHGGRAELQE